MYPFDQISMNAKKIPAIRYVETQKGHLNVTVLTAIACKMISVNAKVCCVLLKYRRMHTKLICLPHALYIMHIDVNECLEAALNTVDLCKDINSECLNTEGSYVCTCVPGYERINETCSSKCYSYYLNICM